MIGKCSSGLILGNAGATLYGGVTTLALTAHLAQFNLLDKLEVALDPLDILHPFVFSDVSAALVNGLNFVQPISTGSSNGPLPGSAATDVSPAQKGCAASRITSTASRLPRRSSKSQQCS